MKNNLVGSLNLSFRYILKNSLFYPNRRYTFGTENVLTDEIATIHLVVESNRTLIMEHGNTNALVFIML